MKSILSNKKLIFALCVLLTAVFALTFVFILENISHDCSGEDCHICLQLAAVNNAARHLVTALPATAAALFAVLFFRAVFVAAGNIPACFNPISLKVKLNN